MIIGYNLKLKRTVDTLTEFGRYIEDCYKKYLSDYKPDHPWNSIATGNLYKSVRATVHMDGKDVEVIIELADYWKELEEGQPIGTIVSIDRIKNWITAKGIIPQARNGGNIPTENQLAYLIKRKIYREGTEPTNFMEYTIDEAISMFEMRLADALEEDLANELEGRIYSIIG